MFCVPWPDIPLQIVEVWPSLSNIENSPGDSNLYPFEHHGSRSSRSWGLRSGLRLRGSALHGDGSGLVCDLQGIVGSSWGAHCCCVHEGLTSRGAWSEGKCGEAPLLVSVWEFTVLSPSWDSGQQGTVCSTYWGLPCVCGGDSGRGCVDSKH